jgi:vacuolar-type H+-ATPase subunit F/Vma7
VNVVALGADAELAGFVLAGVRVLSTATDEETLGAWTAMDDDVGLVILTRRAAESLRDVLDERPRTLTVVTP